MNNPQTLQIIMASYKVNLLRYMQDNDCGAMAAQIFRKIVENDQGSYKIITSCKVIEPNYNQ